MKKISITLFITFLAGVSLAQTQSKTNFEFGIRYRITPIYLSTQSSSGYYSNNPYSIEPDKQMIGYSLITGFEQILSSKFSLNFHLATRYHYKMTEYNTSVGANNIIKDFFFDHIIGVNYKLIHRKKFDLAIGFGFSSCNHNSDYSYTIKEPIPGRPISDSGFHIYNRTLKFETTDFPITMTFPNVKFSIVPSINSSGNDFEIQGSRFVLLNFNLLYSINIPKKKSKE